MRSSYGYFWRLRFLLNFIKEYKNYKNNKIKIYLLADERRVQPHESVFARERRRCDDKTVIGH
jgi:hypothetical protein